MPEKHSDRWELIEIKLGIELTDGSLDQMKTFSKDEWPWPRERGGEERGWRGGEGGQRAIERETWGWCSKWGCVNFTPQPEVSPIEPVNR